MGFSVHQESVTTTAIEIIKTAEKRTGYRIVYPTGGGTITIGRGGALTATTGYVTIAGVPEVFRKKHGENVKDSVWAIASAGTIVVSIREEFEEERR